MLGINTIAIAKADQAYVLPVSSSHEREDLLEFMPNRLAMSIRCEKTS